MEIQIVALILSTLALIVSVLVFIDSRNKTKLLQEQSEDNRRKTQIMESQLKLLQEQSESKQDTRKALGIVSELQEMIPKLGTKKYDWGDFGIAPQRLLEMLHDSGQTAIQWDVRPYSLFGKSIGNGKGPLREDIRNFEAFKRSFEEMVPNPESKFEIRYISQPKILLDPDNEIGAIEVKDFLLEVHTLGQLCKNLKSVEKVVSMYDASILSDLQKLYSKALRALYEVFGEDQIIEISSKIKTRDIQSHLLNFIAFDKWQESLKELKEKIRPRLIEVMRHLQEIS